MKNCHTIFASRWAAGGLDRWQSFTAGKTGLLTQLELNAGSGLGNESQAGVLQIYAGEGPAGRSWRPRWVTFQYKLYEFQTSWRRGWDSNPRAA